MSNKLKAILLIAIAAVVAVTFSRREQTPASPFRELTRAQLEFRDDRLFAKGEAEPFNGTLVEPKRTSIDIRDGRPHGVSRGWYDNGQLEVEEHFVDGTSHGLRTRWHANGMKKSQAQIVHGQIEGVFTRWHDNGKVAATAEMSGGRAHGVSEAFDRAGGRIAHVVLKGGEVVRRELVSVR